MPPHVHLLPLKPLKDRHTAVSWEVRFPRQHQDLVRWLVGQGMTSTPDGRSFRLMASPAEIGELLAAGRSTFRYLPWSSADAPRPSGTAVPDTRETILQRYLDRLAASHYSPRTINSYRHAFRHFLKHIAPRHPNEVLQEEVIEYLDQLQHEKPRSASYRNQIINAIKCWYEKVEDLDWQVFEIERPSQVRQLPKVLSREEVGRMIRATGNLKHKCLLLLAYGAGLRSAELLALEKDHVDPDRRVIRVAMITGQHRELPLPAQSVPALGDYIREYKPAKWLFEGKEAGTPYSARSLQQAVARAARSAGLRKRVTPNMLRHSYATHLLEAGADVRYLQGMMGHRNPGTTNKYFRIAGDCKPTSPLDSLPIGH